MQTLPHELKFPLLDHRKGEHDIITISTRRMGHSSLAASAGASFTFAAGPHPFCSSILPIDSCSGLIFYQQSLENFPGGSFDFRVQTAAM